MNCRRATALALAALLGAAVIGTGEAQEPAATIAREPLALSGASESHTPAEYNHGVTFRYFVVGAPPPEAVLVFIPGLNSGVNTFDIMARQLLARAPRIEVWVTAPRATLLQDRRGILAALAYGNPDFALAYYYGGLSIDGATYRPLPSDSVAYAAYWGLDVTLRDVYAAVQEAHRRYPGVRVFLGGHSLGGILAALYAGYDFGRPPGPSPVRMLNGVPAPSPDAGARDLSGLVLLDGVPFELAARLTSKQYLDGVHIPLLAQIPGVRDLLGARGRRRAGPFADLADIARPRDSILFDVIAAYAYLRPDAPSHLPFAPRDGLAITNEALLGAVLSDRIERDLFLRTSIGAPLGEFPRIPDPEGIYPDGLLDLAHGRPAPGRALIEWIPYDRSVPRGRVDLRALEAAIFRPGADFTQWYLPWRLILDLGLAVDLDTSDAFAARFDSLTQVRYTALPILILGAGHGLIRRPQTAAFYRSHIATPPARVHVEIFPDFSHLDLVDAADNPAAERIVDWLQTVLH